MTNSFAESRKLVIDAHVHMYDCFGLSDFISSAYHNLSKLAGDKNENSNTELVLLLTETSRENGFRRLVEASLSPDKPLFKSADSWYCQPTGEQDSVVLASNSGGRLSVIAGQQIVSAEGLEVHALATAVKVSDGQSLDATLHEITQSGAIAALPWGTGKWLGRRGRLLHSRINDLIKAGVLLSDSGVRPKLWPESTLFRSGIRVIAGTDPLPLTQEASRVGSYAVTLDAGWEPDAPARSVRSCFAGSTMPGQRLGSRQGLLQFLSRQVAIRL